jgi:hypothetical protein
MFPLVLTSNLAVAAIQFSSVALSVPIAPVSLIADSKKRHPDRTNRIESHVRRVNAQRRMALQVALRRQHVITQHVVTGKTTHHADPSAKIDAGNFGAFNISTHAARQS